MERQHEQHSPSPFPLQLRAMIIDSAVGMGSGNHFILKERAGSISLNFFICRFWEPRKLDVIRRTPRPVPLTVNCEVRPPSPRSRTSSIMSTPRDFAETGCASALGPTSELECILSTDLRQNCVSLTYCL